MKFARVSLAFAVFSVSALAQFYAPDTEFHDIAQRTFPVEAARVLAWQHRRAGEGIAEVKFDVRTTPERETVWTIRWLDAAGKSLREKTVRYPESLLVEGPKFFREVFQQLAGDDWTIPSAPPGDAIRAYWKGAELAGVARLEAVQAADTLLAEKPDLAEPAEAANLAGILIEGAMPSIANSMSLDSVLLSRGAAWLCTAEARTGAPLEAAWAPILFLAGRDPAADALWAALPPAPSEKRPAPERFWNLQLRNPSTPDCFLFAVPRENRAFAMPAMMWPHHFDVWWTMKMLDVIHEILDDDFIQRLYEYGPNISIVGGYAGGNFGAPMPGLAAKAVIDALHDFKPGPGDFTGYQALLERIDHSGDEPGMKNLAPLLNLGLDEGTGPLIPVATVTARDILGYGWEQIALQLGYARHARERIDDKDAAQALTKFVLKNLKGVSLFFPDAATATPAQDPRRWQFVASSKVSDALRDHVPEWEKPADILFRRRWLMSTGGNRELEAMIRHGGSPEECRIIIDRMQKEGSPTAYQFLLNFDADTRYPDLINRLGIRARLTAPIRTSATLRYMTLREDYHGKDDPLGYARALEEAGWDSGAFPSPSTIFQKYVEAGAREAAKRFYDEVQPFLNDRDSEHGILGGDRFALAWLEQDAPAMRRAANNGATSFGGNTDVQVAYAVLYGDAATVPQFLEMLSARSMKGDDFAALKDWYPLAAALRDPKHPDHTRAIESFPHKSPRLLLLRWTLAVEAKLPVDEGERLLATQDDNQSKLFIAALRGDKDQFDKLHYDVLRSLTYDGPRVLIADLRRQLHAVPLRTDIPDLKPPDARPVGELIREALAKRK